MIAPALIEPFVESLLPLAEAALCDLRYSITVDASGNFRVRLGRNGAAGYTGIVNIDDGEIGTVDLPAALLDAVLPGAVGGFEEGRLSRLFSERFSAIQEHERARPDAPWCSRRYQAVPDQDATEFATLEAMRERLLGHAQVQKLAAAVRSEIDRAIREDAAGAHRRELAAHKLWLAASSALSAGLTPEQVSKVVLSACTEGR